MAQYRTSPVLRVRRELAWLKATGAAVVTVLAFAGLTGAAQAPATALAVAPALVAEIGTDTIVTGSIGDMFNTGFFAGPNRAEKQDRARPQEDVATVVSKFDGIRAKLAALMHPQTVPVAATAMAVPGSTPAADPAAAPVAVASLDPNAGTEALAAIGQIAGGEAPPIPITMSDKLAYARADVPVTVFDGSVMSKAGQKVSDKDVWCMATAIYFEARGESYRGQVAVGQVVMNRVAHRLYPKTICAVVFQNEDKRNACQFSFACDGIPERVTDQSAWALANQIAKDVISGKEYLPEVGYATHYHATYVYPHWAPRMKKVTKIGMHVFYQFKRGWRFG